jgi:Glyoxalase-like domain
MTRREWLERVASTATAWYVGSDAVKLSSPLTASDSRTTMAAAPAARDAVDHLLLGAPDLDAGIAWFGERTGVKAAIGGVHPGAGTRNALASLGRRQYLEIIAPDPAQSAFNFQIDLRRLRGPRLVTWAAATADVQATAAAATKTGYKIFGPRDGSRARPDGITLHWRSVGVLAGFAEPEVDPTPFFIQWAADSRHPSSDSPQGCRLTALELHHPDPAKLQAALASLGIDAAVTKSETAGLRATLETPKGRVVID